MGTREIKISQSLGHPVRVIRYERRVIMSTKLRQGIIAIIVSAVCNISLILSVTFRDPVKHPIPALDSLVDAIFKPGEAVAKIFVAPGHDFAYLVGMPLLSLGFSIIFYGFLVWIVFRLSGLWKSDGSSTKNS